MKIIAVVNDKGGVGKTFLTENLAFHFAQMGKRTLVIDFDLQENTTSFFCEDDDRSSIPGAAAIFRKNPELSFIPAKVMGEVAENLFICPANDELRVSLNGALELKKREMLLQFAIEDSAEKFDYVLIDCPPNPVSIQKDNALTCATDIIVPVRDDINSVNGVLGIVEDVAQNNELEPTIRVITNLYSSNRKNLNRQLESWLEALGESVVDLQETLRRAQPFTYILDELKIPNLVIAGDAQSNMCPLVLAAPKSPTNIALETLASRYY